ncbi:MAG: Xaa-Pro dipeptidase [Thermoanaerobaculia bacterium]|nr:Xaa-Pro dipeptidase [Thermoanaerobaculia bacterium]
MPHRSDLAALYRNHLDQLTQYFDDAVERAGAAGTPLDGAVFHSGRVRLYHRDDEEIPFRPTPHYRRWIPPQGGPEHVVFARPGRKPTVVRVLPVDFWFDTTPPAPSYWEDAVELKDVQSFDEVPDALGLNGERIAYLGDSPEAAAELHIAESLVEPETLIAPLDWHRAVKTPYEITLTRLACEAAAAGHLAAREQFLAGSTEREVHHQYLQAADRLESEMPYGTIIAFNEKTAILHYQHKRGDAAGTGHSCLVDAGGAFHGYAADITRTWAVEDAHPVFREFIRELEATERHLVGMIQPGRSFVDLHLEAHHRCIETLRRLGVLRCSTDEAQDLRLSRLFFPHGLGHHLGLQVHDVGGHQTSPAGGCTPPPDEHVLRNTRTMEPGHLLTIEPGIYFIPLLLDSWRDGAHASAFDWQLIDQLIPLGGVRVEDDVLCTDSGFEDLTHELIEGRLAATLEPVH